MKNLVIWVIQFFVLSLFILPIAHAEEGRFYCSGTEPFWSLTIASDKVGFKNADEAMVEFKPSTPLPITPNDIDTLRIYQTKAYKTNKLGVFIVQKQNCSDGMSEHKYDYQTIILYDNQAYHGCCMRK